MPMTFVGRFAVLVMICVGVVLIPVQASQVYSQLQARRVTLGETPHCIVPLLLLTTISDKCLVLWLMMSKKHACHVLSLHSSPS